MLMAESKGEKSVFGRLPKNALNIFSLKILKFEHQQQWPFLSSYIHHLIHRFLVNFFSLGFTPNLVNMLMDVLRICFLYVS